MNPAASFSLTSAVGRFTAVVLQLRVITQFSANRRWATEVIFATIQLMLMISSSSSSLWLILNPSFFPRVDISAAVCDAQRVGSWPYKVMSALTRAGLMTLSLSPSWHYYHSQAQARDITPKTFRLRIRITVGEKLLKELCLFPNLQQLSGVPLILLHNARHGGY